MKFLYLDSSTLVSVALGDLKRSAPVWKLIKESHTIGTSELAVVECQAGLSHQLADRVELLTKAEQNLNQLLGRMTLYFVGSLVLGHARTLVKRYRNSMGLRSSDAIHLSTLNLIQQGLADIEGFLLQYLTSDRKQHAAFTAEGHMGKCLD